MKQSQSFYQSLIVTAVLSSALVACSGSKSEPAGPVVLTSQNKPVETKPTVLPGSDLNNRIAVTAVVDKETILGTEFLYGADLQYSSYADPALQLYLQSLAVGHIPVRFRVSGKELQLISDNTRFSQSDVNHPNQLISRFPILSEDEKTLTIGAPDSRVYLSQVFEGTRADTMGGMTKREAPAPKDYWVRSFQYDAKDRLILVQSSLQGADGTIGEFAESLMPRSLIKPSEKFEKFEMNPTSPTGSGPGIAASDLLDRFLMLPGFKIFKGEEPRSYAQHFDIGSGATIDWYVTPNIPDEYLKPVELAVVGWNRYFKQMKGIEREVVRFMGRMKPGMVLGDPRYNIINWDSRIVAGAAYESQATDPETGKQSHSVIYLPAAWLKIGVDYWKLGQYSAQKAMGAERESHHPMLACERDVGDAAAFLASGRVAPETTEEFSLNLLKAVLFHEVGHALGLNHNFKGSLSYDRSKPDSLFSYSIMDYNNFEVENAFSAVNTADGPSLEYDRQALSAIYNGAKDVSEKDLKIAACNDEMADTEDGGVDPLCIRYDVEKDPTLSVTTAFSRIENDVLDGDTTLVQALKNAMSRSATASDIGAAAKKEEFDAIEARLFSSINGVLNYYFVTGRSGIARTVRTNTKSMLQFQEKVLLDGYDELAMRTRASNGVVKALKMKKLPKNISVALAQIAQASVETLKKTPYVQKLDSKEAEKLITAKTKKFSEIGENFEKDATAMKTGLGAMRGQIAASLARKKRVPFYFGRIKKTEFDFEPKVATLLADMVVRSAEIIDVKIVAAKSLATFQGRDAGDAQIKRVLKKLQAQLQSAKNNEDREEAIALITALTAKAGG